MSCPTRITAASNPSCNRPRVTITCLCTTTSSALVGSSATITLGSSEVAVAMPTRCFMPPLSSCGIHPGDIARQANAHQQIANALPEFFLGTLYAVVLQRVNHLALHPEHRVQ